MKKIKKHIAQDRIANQWLPAILRIGPIWGKETESARYNASSVRFKRKLNMGYCYSYALLKHALVTAEQFHYRTDL